MAVIRGQMIQRIMTGMPLLGLAVHIMGGMITTIMIMIMTVAIVVLIQLLNTNGSRIMILTTRIILYPQMALIGHHARVEMRFLTRTHPLKQRIGIDTGVTMGIVPMTVAVIAPLTRQAC
jgi:hypothetical protein